MLGFAVEGNGSSSMIFFNTVLITVLELLCMLFQTATGQERGANLTLYMHSLSTVQLFVYLFAPAIHLLCESDFDSLKLENGLRLWQPLWDYQQPDIPCFASPVKPQRSILKAQRSLLKVSGWK
jgi:hypothetical protein